MNMGGIDVRKKLVVLRSLRNDDSALLFDWINSRELRIMNAPFRPTSEAQHQAWIQWIGSREDMVIFMIEELETRHTVGTCQLRSIDPVAQSAELQIRIGRTSDQGRGLGGDAVAALVEFGFTDLNLRRISLQVFASNARAVRVYEGNGFVVEGCLREAAFVDGKWTDVLCMGTLKAERG